MGLPVSIKVNFRGNVKRFVAPDLDRSEWESVEAWIKASFGISHFQVKYFDEDNEEVSINSQEEYEEGVKSADKQGNQLHVNVYKAKQCQAGTGPLKTQEVKELKGDLRPAPPYPSRVKTVDKGTQVTPERDAVVVKDNKVTKPEEKLPPAWFRSYMEKFKDEVVKEVVERMCNDFSGQCCTHKDLGAVGGVNIKGPKVNSSSTGPPAYSSLGYTPDCSKCKRPATDGAYKCSVCPSCILCELCQHSHDPSHDLVRTKTPLSIPEHGMAGELRFPRRGDWTMRKAERQHLKAERRQLKAEVKEIKKKLRLEKRGLQWSGPASTSARSNMATTQAPALAPAATQAAEPGSAPDPQASSPEAPEVSYTTLVPTMAALFLDENLPEETRREPGTKFIKYWKMKNSGIINWTPETKLKCMWGNLALASEEMREVAVPLLQPGQVGVVSVAFIAPVMEGTYTSHWRLAHCGEQFGPRVGCSIVVALSTSPHAWQKEESRPVGVEKVEGMLSNSSRDSGLAMSVDYCHRDYYFPSVDLLTAQGENSDPPWPRGGRHQRETVIRSLALEEAPNHRHQPSYCKPEEESTWHSIEIGRTRCADDGGYERSRFTSRPSPRSRCQRKRLPQSNQTSRLSQCLGDVQLQTLQLPAPKGPSRYHRGTSQGGSVSGSVCLQSCSTQRGVDPTSQDAMADNEWCANTHY